MQKLRPKVIIKGNMEIMNYTLCTIIWTKNKEFGFFLCKLPSVTY